MQRCDSRKPNHHYRNVGCGAVKSLIATPTGKNFAFGGLDAMPSGMVLDASGAGVNHFDQDSVGGYIWWLADGQTGTAYLCVGTPQAHTINAYACHPETRSVSSVRNGNFSMSNAWLLGSKP